MGARIDPRSHRRAALSASVIFTIATAIAACSSESNPKPPDNNFTTSSGSTSGSDATSTTTTSASGTGGSSATSSTGSSASSTTGAGGGGTGGAPPNCDGVNGCYSCPPKTGNQLLNACTGAQCSPFDNVARLPLYNNGNLPAIP